jgi:hypothetical protein
VHATELWSGDTVLAWWLGQLSQQLLTLTCFACWQGGPLATSGFAR